MATAQQNTPRRETVDFPPNVPVTLSLAYSEPRKVSGQRGERFMYSTCDNRALFLDPPVAAQIAELGINVREAFSITRHSTGKKGAADTWTVARISGRAAERNLCRSQAPRRARPEAPAARGALDGGSIA